MNEKLDLRCRHFIQGMYNGFLCCPDCHATTERTKALAEQRGTLAPLTAPPKGGWQFMASSTTATVCCLMRAHLAHVGREVWAQAIKVSRSESSRDRHSAPALVSVPERPCKPEV